MKTSAYLGRLSHVLPFVAGRFEPSGQGSIVICRYGLPIPMLAFLIVIALAITQIFAVAVSDIAFSIDRAPDGQPLMQTLTQHGKFAGMVFGGLVIAAVGHWVYRKEVEFLLLLVIHLLDAAPIPTNHPSNGAEQGTETSR